MQLSIRFGCISSPWSSPGGDGLWIRMVWRLSQEEGESNVWKRWLETEAAGLQLTKTGEGASELWKYSQRWYIVVCWVVFWSTICVCTEDFSPVFDLDTFLKGKKRRKEKSPNLVIDWIPVESCEKASFSEGGWRLITSLRATWQ